MAISINKTNDFPDIELTKYDSRFISEIHNELTMFGELQHSIPQRQIIENIKTSARFFYNNASYATSNSFFILRASDIKAYTKSADVGASDFNGVFVKVPPQIRIVSKLNFLNTSSPQGDFERSFDMLNMGMQTGVSGNAPLRNLGLVGYGGIDKDLFFMEHVVKMVESQAVRSIIGKVIPYKYNPENSTLHIQAKITQDIGLTVKCDLPIYNLYNDDLFRRHVISLCHQSLKRKIAGLTIELPSGATLSADEICNKFEDAKDVEELVKNGSGLGAMIIKVK